MERVHPSLFCKACQDNVFVADVHDHYKDSANHPKCTLCGIGLIDDAAFREHAIHQHLDLYCQTCSVLVDSMDQMQLHYNETPEIHPLCGSCQRAFQDQSVYDEHMGEAHAKPVFSCTTCCISVTSEDELQQHYREAGPPIHAWCRRCEEAFATDEELALHNRALHTMIRCEVCRVYVDTEELAQHWNEAPQALHPSCTVCGIGFENQTIYLSHAFETHPELCCDTCFLAFKTLHELQDHFREYSAVHDNCAYCGEGFRNDVELFEHLEIHQSEPSEPDSTHSNTERYEAQTSESTISNVSLLTQQILQFGGETPSDTADVGRSRTSSGERPASTNSSRAWVEGVAGMMNGKRMSATSSSVTVSTGAAVQGAEHDSDSERDSSFVTPRVISPFNSQDGIELPIELPLSHSADTRGYSPSLTHDHVAACSTTNAGQPARAKYFLNCRSCLQDPEEPVAAICGHIFCHRCFIQVLAQHGRCTVCETLFLVRLSVEDE
ncbi:hypothetical protein K474DRAFT_1316274 [Panus rudis PR-1116 ss-1]|nr:hypothetical protein K474DRAFT_1316274 [Panus rudis PR-1116 ss-1]